MKVLLPLLLLVTTLFSQVNIGYEATILPHIEEDFDFNPDIQYKMLIGKEYVSIFFAYVPKNQEISNEKEEEILNTMINYRGYSLTQTYFSDKLSVGLQVNPTNWFGLYVGTINGGKIELSDKYDNLYNITKKTGVQFGFVFTPKITDDLYLGLGTGWNNISNCSQVSAQIMFKINGGNNDN